MRICVPLLEKVRSVSDDCARDISLAPHLGLAECFAVIDSESGEVLGECRISGRCPGACSCPLPDLAAERVDALAGRAMGYRLMQMSRRAGLPVMAVSAPTLGQLRDEIRGVSFIGAPPSRPALPATVCLTGGGRPAARSGG